MPQYPPKHLQTPEWEEGIALLADMLLRACRQQRPREELKETATAKKRTRKRQPVE